MRTFQEIHQEIDRLSAERAELYKQLAEYDAAIVADVAVDAELDRLWDEHRAARAGALR